MPIKSNIDNLIDFAVAVDRFVTEKRLEGDDHPAYNQVSRSSTSIMANFAESMRSETVKDCKLKLGIALKEAMETRAWVYFLWGCDRMTNEQYEDLAPQLKDIIITLQDDVQACITEENPSAWMKKLANLGRG